MSMTYEDGAYGDALEELTRLGGLTKDRPWLLRYAVFRFGAQARADLYREVAVYLDREVRLPEALATLYAIETGGEEDGDLVRIGATKLSALGILIPYWLHAMRQSGHDWYEVLAEMVPSREAQMIGAIGEAGMTGDALRKLALSIRRLNEARTKIRNALLPVAFMLLVIAGALYAASVSLLPDLFKALPNMQLRGEAASLKEAADFIRDWGLLTCGGAVLFIAAVWWSLDNLTGRVRIVLDRIPALPWALHRQWTGASWLEAMALLIGAERKIPEALQLLRVNASPYVAERLDALLVQDDARLGAALARTGFGWPDDRTIRAMRVYMSGNRPQDGLAALAADQQQDLSDRMLAAAGIATYAGASLIGCLVGWLLWASWDLYKSAVPGLGPL